MSLLMSEYVGLNQYIPKIEKHFLCDEKSGTALAVPPCFGYNETPLITKHPCIHDKNQLCRNFFNFVH